MTKKLGLVVMTGGTSGVGLFAARRLLGSCEALVLGTRQSPALDGSISVPVDLRSLDNVRSFTREVERLADGRSIDALILNAGGGFPDGRSADGYELNFAVNHLAHYLLLRLLSPRLSNGATVILTTSGTHDPAEKTMIPPPVHADAFRLAHPDAFRLAHPDRDPDRNPSPSKAAGQAYSASKLCNLLTARRLAASSDAIQRRLRVIAFSPGPTPGTGLVRDRGAVLSFTWRYVGPVLRLLMPRLNSPDDAGRALADLALGAASPPPGHIYALFERGSLIYPPPSELAHSDEAMEAMWRDSAVLAGLDTAVAREGRG